MVGPKQAPKTFSSIIGNSQLMLTASVANSWITPCPSLSPLLTQPTPFMQYFFALSPISIPPIVEFHKLGCHKKLKTKFPEFSLTYTKILTIFSQMFRIILH